MLRVLAKRLDLRDKVVATAAVLLQRFYTRASLLETDVLLLCAAATYVGAKVQESPVHIRTLTHEAHALWQGSGFVEDTTRLAEAEFLLIAELDAELVVHLPFAVLEDVAPDLALARADIDAAWWQIYGTFTSDVPLLYPPHIVCLTCVYMACVQRRLAATSKSAHKLSAATATGRHAARDTAAVDAETSKSLELLRDLLGAHNIDRSELARCTQHVISAAEFRRQRQIVTPLSKHVVESAAGSGEEGSGAVLHPYKILQRARAAFEREGLKTADGTTSNLGSRQGSITALPGAQAGIGTSAATAISL